MSENKQKQQDQYADELLNKDTLEELKELKSWWDSIGFNTKTDLKLSLDPNKIKEQIGGGTLEVGQTFGGRQQTKHYIKDNTTKEVYKNIQSIIDDICEDQRRITEEIILYELYDLLKKEGDLNE